MTTTISTEEMRQQAEQNGSLRIWHEFSWSFPFYRIHFVSVYKGVDQYDQGMSPLPFVGATVACSDTFLNLMSSLWSRVILPVAAAIAVADFTALLASNAGPTGFIAALLISLGTKMGGLMANWNSVDGLISVFVGYIFSTVLGLLRYGMFRLVVDSLKVVMDIGSIAEIGFGNLYRILSFPISIAFGGRTLVRLHELGVVA